MTFPEFFLTGDQLNSILWIIIGASYRVDESRILESIAQGLAMLLCLLRSRLILFAAGLSVLFDEARVSFASEAAQTDQPSPNLVLILADDLGFSDLGCYGGEINTDHLDRLASRGVRFTQFYNSARCWPSRAAMLTGYYPQQIRRDGHELAQRSMQGRRPPWAPLLSARLRDHGYRCFVSGKWHLDGTPAENGFDRSFLIEDHDRHFAPHRVLLDGTPLQLDSDSSKEHFYSSTSIADRALEFLNDHVTHREACPFFLYLAFTSPHFPLHAPREDIEHYSAKYSEGWDEIRRQRSRRQQAMNLPFPPPSPLEPTIGPPYRFANVQEVFGDLELVREVPWQSLDENQQRFQSQKMRVHAAMVERMDREIGRIVQWLEARSQLDDTIIVFLSDNGASAEIMIRGDGHRRESVPGSADSFLCLGPGWSRASNTPFRRHKTWVHEGGIATPCIVHWPHGNFNVSPLRHQVAHIIDLAPTLLDLSGVAWRVTDPTAPPVPGRSLKSALLHDAPNQSRELWWLHEGNRAIRDGVWKLVASREQPWELYNMSDDRGEARDLRTQHPDVAERLAIRWSVLHEQFIHDSESR